MTNFNVGDKFILRIPDKDSYVKELQLPNSDVRYASDLFYEEAIQFNNTVLTIAGETKFLKKDEDGSHRFIFVEECEFLICTRFLESYAEEIAGSVKYILEG